MTSTGLQGHLMSAVAGGRLSRCPWAHAHLPGTLPPEQALRLSHGFDRFDLSSFEETGRAKTYRLRTGRIDDLDRDRLPGAEWRDLMDALCGPEYRRLVGELTGVQLAGAGFSVEAWEYRNGDWLAPHVDKPDKIVTHIIYLTERWCDGDGGRLLMLGSSDPLDRVQVLPPALGSSVVLVRSEHSWHAVEAPRTGACDRRSVTATFWRGPGPAPRG
jgi:Rps23 Pro-64 3,4-dihydroxylase Tpa1-like proline 4-hydroxylase